METAFLWGLIATSSLILGGLIALLVKPGKKLLGIIMAFGAGALISAVAYALMFEALRLAKGSGFPACIFFGEPWSSFSATNFWKAQADRTGRPSIHLNIPVWLSPWSWPSPSTAFPNPW